MFSLIFILEITFKLYFHGARWIVRDVWNFAAALERIACPASSSHAERLLVIFMCKRAWSHVLLWRRPPS